MSTLILNFSLILIAAFTQGCSSGFETIHVSSSTALNSTSKGEKLYAENCASCHGPIFNSMKTGRTAAQIMFARNNEPAMAHLQHLTQSDIQAIAIALNPTAGTPVYQCKSPQLRGITADRMRKLTVNQLRNTLRDLLGTEVYGDATIQSKLNGLPVDTVTTSVTEVNDSPSVYVPQALFNIGLRVAEILKANATTRGAVLGTCASAATITDACVDEILEKFALKVWRRPLKAEEKSDYKNFFTTVGGGLDGLGYLTMRLLQSPSLVFHVEDGTSVSNGRFRLSDYEIASRVSYMAADTMPDSELFAAAKNGELQNVENVRTHTSRMLARGVGKVQDFVRFYAHMNTVASPMPILYSSLSISGAALTSQMKQESADFVDYIIWNKAGTFADLMTSNASFPRSSAMASILETTIATGMTPSLAPGHYGLLHRPALLASAGPRTSPIIRGAEVRKVILCDALGDPPDDAVTARKEEVGNLDALPNREGVTRLTSSNNCVGCHGLINHLGFTFENFNQLGQRRTTEQLISAQGQVTATFSIDTSVNAPNIENGGPSSLSNSVELVQSLAKSTKAKACFSRKIFEYYTLRSAQPDKDGCALAETEQATNALDLRSQIINSIANEDIFWRKQP